MKRVSLNTQKLSPNFIGSWILNPSSICDSLVKHFEDNVKEQKRGVVTGGINLDVKNSTDLKIRPKDICLADNGPFQLYFKNLYSCYQDYSRQWPFLTSVAKNLQISSFNLQKYQSGQHYQKLHTERGNLETLHRVFAWMTYLNDVDDKNGGSTFFSHYKLSIQPKKGLTLIWPAEWTHAHRGNILKAGNKYIITGWMTFPNDQ
jgi:hypothetical protein